MLDIGFEDSLHLYLAVFDDDVDLVATNPEIRGQPGLDGEPHGVITFSDVSIRCIDDQIDQIASTDDTDKTTVANDRNSLDSVGQHQVTNPPDIRFGGDADNLAVHRLADRPPLDLNVSVQAMPIVLLELVFGRRRPVIADASQEIPFGEDATDLAVVANHGKAADIIGAQEQRRVSDAHRRRGCDDIPCHDVFGLHDGSPSSLTLGIRAIAAPIESQARQKALDVIVRRRFGSIPERLPALGPRPAVLPHIPQRTSCRFRTVWRHGICDRWRAALL